MLKIAVFGLGNIGRYALEALELMPDGECCGLVRRKIGQNSFGIPEFASLEDLIAAKGKPDVALLALPSRQAPDAAKACLALGVNTVDSYDIHDQLGAVLPDLHECAKKYSKVCITAAGWDPGSDSVIRALFEAMTPTGTSFTNFGRGRSMGHSVAARAIAGVADATSITIPMGGGRHSRLVYVVLEQGANFEDVKTRIAADHYFSHDPLDVRQVSQAELPFVADASHGVLLERVGASGKTSNQQLSFTMRIDNPALTAQIMVSCARAAVRLEEEARFGAKTLIDIPPVALLPGSRLENVIRLV